MIPGQPTKNLLAFARYSQNRAPFIFGVRSSCKQAFPLRAINKFNRTVVLQSKPLGRVCDCDSRSLRSACDLQKKLMLLWLQT
jgi:hypothetical protein